MSTTYYENILEKQPTTPTTPLATFYFYDDNESGVVINNAIHSYFALDIDIDIEKQQQNKLDTDLDSSGIIYDIYNILKSFSRNIVILIQDLKREKLTDHK